ncbi:MAG: hypothetical protein QOJ19_4909 [Acidimicrobiia bacterium]|nr:hypothetical protein [Acidimicrobiia bacterium]
MTTKPTTTGGRAALDHVVTSVHAEREAIGDVQWLVDVGPARLDGDRSGPLIATFVVDTGPLRVGERFLTGLHLAAPSAATARWPINDVVVWEGNDLHVQALVDPAQREHMDAAAAANTLRLFATLRGDILLRLLEERFTTGHHFPGVATRIVETLQAPPDAPAVPLPPELGIIIGPSERRQETVAGAVAQLVKARRSVLVLTTDNPALDRIMLRAHELAGSPPPGVFVRVGVPSTAAVAADPRLTVAAPAMSPPPAVLQRLDAGGGPGTADPPRGPGQPGQMSGPAAALDGARRRLVAADASLAAALVSLRSAASAHALHHRVSSMMEGARAVFQRLDELAGELERETGDIAASAGGVGRLAADTAAAHRPAPSRDGTAERQLMAAAEVAARRLDRRNETLSEFNELLERSHLMPFRRSEVSAAGQNLTQSRTAHAAAERAALRARDDRERAAATVTRLSAELTGLAAGVAGPPPPAIAHAGLHAASQLPPNFAAQRATGESSDEARASAARQLAGHRNNVLSRAAAVGATLHELLTDPAIYQRRYDNVLIEQAGQMPAAFAIFGATRASRALTLAVEPRRRPRVETSNAEGDPEALRRWLTASLPELCDLDRVESVAHHISALILD